MDIQEIKTRFAPAVQEIIDLCSISDSLFDRESFLIYIATIWGNTVSAPERAGISEADLEMLHNVLNEEIKKRLSEDVSVTSCYEFVLSKKGEEAMSRMRLTPQHKEFLEYFARLILSG